MSADQYFSLLALWPHCTASHHCAFEMVQEWSVKDYLCRRHIAVSYIIFPETAAFHSWFHSMVWQPAMGSVACVMSGCCVLSRELHCIPLHCAEWDISSKCPCVSLMACCSCCWCCSSAISWTGCRVQLQVTRGTNQRNVVLHKHCGDGTPLRYSLCSSTWYEDT